MLLLYARIAEFFPFHDQRYVGIRGKSIKGRIRVWRGRQRIVKYLNLVANWIQIGCGHGGCTLFAPYIDPSVNRLVSIGICCVLERGRRSELIPRGIAESIARYHRTRRACRCSETSSATGRMIGRYGTIGIAATHQHQDGKCRNMFSHRVVFQERGLK